MANQYGKNIHLSIYGGSHDTEIGMHLAGFPAGLALDREELLTLTAFFSAHYLFAQIISYCCGVLNSLWMNKRFTFREKNAMGTKRVLAFFAVNLVSLGVSTLVLFLCVDKMGLGNLLGKCVSVVFSLGVNFVLNKLIVFRD